MSSRGIAPVVGVLALLTVVTTLGGVVAAVVPGMVDETAHNEPVAIDQSFDLEDRTLVYTLQHGSSIQVDDLEMTIAVNDEPLENQPSVPNTSMPGFSDGPRGAFHDWGPDTWEPGTTAALTVSSSNLPSIAPGDTVTTTFYIDGQRIAEITSTASA